MGLGSDFMSDRDYQQAEDVRQQQADRKASRIRYYEDKRCEFEWEAKADKDEERSEEKYAIED